MQSIKLNDILFTNTCYNLMSLLAIFQLYSDDTLEIVL